MASKPRIADDIHPQASRFFAQLHDQNEFTAVFNTFQEIFVQRIHVTSDRSQKQNITPLPDHEGTELVRHLMPYRYTINGRPAAGLMADEVPASYTHRNTTLSVDYNSLIAELWASVRDAHARLDRLEGARECRDVSNIVPSTSNSASHTPCPG